MATRQSPSRAKYKSRKSSADAAASEGADAANARLHPKLRMVRNCDPDINQVRAELSATLFVPNTIARYPRHARAGRNPADAGV